MKQLAWVFYYHVGDLRFVVYQHSALETVYGARFEF